MKIKTYLFAAVLSVLTTGCNIGLNNNNVPSGTVVAGLRSFENCSDLSGFLAGRRDAGSGFDVPLGRPTVGTFMPMAPDAAGAEDASADGAATAAPETATVEEADLVKRDGSRLYVANASGGLLVYDVSTPTEMHRIGRLAIPGFQPLEMQVAGNKILLVSNASSGDKTKVLAVDAVDPASPSVLKTWEFAGAYRESRQVGSAAYLVLQKWVGGDERTLETQLKEKSPCDRVYVPEDLEGGGTDYYLSWNLVGLSLADLEREPTQVSLIGSFTSAVYATPEHLYLANQSFEEDQTGIYLLSLDPATAGIVPAATAEVPGSVFNQFFMDEKEGIFRIASTARPGDPKNYLTTFRVGADSLAKLGQIDSITPGEAITAVRFLDSHAFLSTAVELKDPLVSVELSDPADPRVKAAIDLPGRPNYIHIWNDLLITVGWGDGWASGVTLSLFNIADADAPVLVEQETIPDAYYSEAQNDHRAFAFFEDRGLLAIPVSGGMTSQIVLYRVQADGLTAFGEVDHDDLMAGTENEDYSPVLRRALEAGDALVTVSEAGIKTVAFGDLGTSLFVEVFPGFSL